MFCKYCGNSIPEDTYTCPYCGKILVNPFDNNENKQQPQPTYDDSGATGFGVLGFFIPIAGIILYFVWKNTCPNRAKASGKGALISIIISFILGIIYAIFIASLVSHGYYY